MTKEKNCTESTDRGHRGERRKGATKFRSSGTKYFFVFNPTNPHKCAQTGVLWRYGQVVYRLSGRRGCNVTGRMERGTVGNGGGSKELKTLKIIDGILRNFLEFQVLAEAVFLIGLTKNQMPNSEE